MGLRSARRVMTTHEQAQVLDAACGMRHAARAVRGVGIVPLVPAHPWRGSHARAMTDLPGGENDANQSLPL